MSLELPEDFHKNDQDLQISSVELSTNLKSSAIA